MDNSNIVISIIIVLCIAAGVTAYSLTNNDSNNVFTNLQGVTPESASDAGDTGVQDTAQSADASSGTGSSSGSSSGSGGSSSGGGSSGGGSSGGGSSGGGSSGYISISKAKSIASGCIGEAGCYIGSVSRSGSTYYCTVRDASGNKVDCILINAKTGAVIGRG